MVIETGVRENFEAGPNRAAFRVIRSVDQAGDARLDDGASTHAARFDRDVERCAGHAVVLKYAGRFANHDHFGVGRGIAVANRPVARASEDIAVMNDQGANRDFAACSRRASLLNGELHK